MSDRDLLSGICVDRMSKHQLADIRQIQIDPTMPKEQRIAKFIADVGNPYCYRYDDVVVKVAFQNEGTSLQDRLTGFLLTKDIQ